MTRYALLCPGQGAQHASMFSLVRDEPAAQPVLIAARAALGCDVEALAGDPGAARANRNAQPLVVAAGVAAWRALARDLPPPALIAGYSVGEVTAYGCAQSFELEELFAIVCRRAALMSEAAPPHSGLIAVRGGAYAAIDELCAHTGAHIAIINGPDRHVIAGTGEALTRFSAKAAALHLQLTRLPIEIPAHTELLHAAAVAFRSALQTSALRAPELPILAGVDGRQITQRPDAIDALATQIAAPVDWYRCMTSLIERGCRVFLELPPGRALSQMLREQFPDIEARAVEEFRSLDAVRVWLLDRVGRDSKF